MSNRIVIILKKKRTKGHATFSFNSILHLHRQRIAQDKSAEVQ